VVLIGIILVLRVHLLVDDDAQGIVVGGRDIQAAMIADHTQIAMLRKRLLQRVIEGVRLAEDAAEVVVHLDLVANPSPINVGAVVRREPDRDDQDQQKDSTRSQSGSAIALTISRVVFDEPNNAKQNEQKWPPVPEPVP